MKKLKFLYDDDVESVIDILNKSDISFDELTFILDLLITLWEDNIRLTCFIDKNRKQEKECE